MSLPGPYRAHLDAAVEHLSMQVNRDTVLQARAALLAEADRLDFELSLIINRGSGVGLCGGDPVSPEAQRSFNERIGALYAHCFSYNRDLREAAGRLDDTARRYGYTEDEIAASFRTTV